MIGGALSFVSKMLSAILLVFVCLVAGAVLLPKYGCDIPVLKSLISDSCTNGDVLGEIRQISELSTAVSTNQVIIKETSAGGILKSVLPGFLTDQTVLLIVVGDVRAGIDLGELEEGDIRVSEDGSVTVNLPEAQIFTVTLDEDRTRILGTESGLLRKLDNDNDLIAEARRRSADEIEATARRNGILESADKNAQETVRVLLQNSGYGEVEFE